MKRRLLLLVAGGLLLGCTDSLAPVAEQGSLRLWLATDARTVPPEGDFTLTVGLYNAGADTVRLSFGSSCLNTFELFRDGQGVEPWSSISGRCLAVVWSLAIAPGDTIKAPRSVRAGTVPGEYRIRANWETSELPSLETKVVVK